MAQIKKKFIGSNQVDGSKILLDNDQAIRGRNAANNADIDILKINSSDELVFVSVPKVGANDLLDASLLGANDGIATLDAGGKIPSSQLPNSIMEYKGNWNASTNSPTLANGTGNAGDVYRASVAGSTDFGAGAISFNVGDFAVYSGSIWEKSINSNEVVSVNGQTGVVSLDSDDVSEGASNFYYTEARFDSSLSGKDTDDLSEGATNLYFTDTRAKTAAVADSITDGITDVAPSQNAVFDALALKADLASPALTGTPTAPTAAPSTNSTQIATTAYVDAAVTAGGGISAVVEDTSPQLGGSLDLNSFSITGSGSFAMSGSTVLTDSNGILIDAVSSNLTLQANDPTYSVIINGDTIDLNAGAAGVVLNSKIDMGATNKVTNMADGTASGDAVNKGQLDLKADLASPALTGTPTAPTQSPGDNSTAIATTAYADAAAVAAAGIQSIVEDTSPTLGGDLDVSTYAIKNSANTTSLDMDDGSGKILMSSAVGIDLVADAGNGIIKLDGTVDMSGRKISSMAAGTLSGDAVEYDQLNTALADYLPLAGGSMSGNIAMAGNKITGLAAGSATGDSVEYDQLNSAISSAISAASLSGGDMISVSSQIISVDLASSSGLESTNPGNAAGQLRVKVDAETIKINGSNEIESLKQTEQKITLIAGDITNQYVDLAHAVHGASASDNSISLTVIGGLLQEKGVDYTVSLTGGSGGVTRITFAGDLATGGASELVATDKLVISYSYLT
jgi:hypothetical protein